MTPEEQDKKFKDEYKRLFGIDIDIGDVSDNPVQKDLAIKEFYEGEFISCDGWGNVVWKDGHETTEEEKKKIDDRFVEMYLDWNNKQYQRDRAKAYPPLEKQLEYIGDHGLEAWQEDIINPIKEKFPKSG